MTLLIRSIVFGILGITTYFKPKIGLGLAAITLCPKLYHRFEENSPTRYIPFSSEKLQQLTTLGHAVKNYGKVHRDGQMVLSEFGCFARVPKEIIESIKINGVANPLDSESFYKNYQFVIIMKNSSGDNALYFNNFEGMKVVVGSENNGQYSLERRHNSGEVLDDKHRYIFSVPSDWSDEKITCYHRDPEKFTENKLFGFMEVFRPQKKSIEQI